MAPAGPLCVGIAEHPYQGAIAVSHNEGLGANWKVRREFWADRPAHEAALRQNLLSLETTRTRHLGSDPNVERYNRS